MDNLQTTETEPVQSFEGMGATCYPEGVYYRVWAPNAEGVSVIGSFNDWKEDANPLSPEENGHWGALIENSKEGDEYKFLLKTPSGVLHRNDPYALKVTNSAGNCVVYNQASFDWQDVSFQIPSWHELVIYELHVGTFHVKESGQVGTLYTAIEKLPYLKDMGFNAVELMPCSEFPGSRSWGYNPASPFAIESDYGGPDGLKAFVKAAHEAGIAVILDVVYNHFGPSDLDIWQFDGWHENDGGGIYFYNDWRAETPWGSTRPDYGRGEVRQYIHDNAMMWLRDYRVDGLRMDMVPYIRNVKADGNPGNDIPEGISLMQWINKDIRENCPNCLTIAEDMHSLDFITDSVEDGGLGYGSQWDARFVHSVREAIITANDQDRNMEDVVEAITHRYNEDSFQRIIYTESHDEVANGQARVAEEIANGDVNNWYSKKRAALGVALVLTSPGIPMVFQGQPLLEDKWFSDSDPIDWSRLEKFSGFATLHRDMIHMRRNWFGVTKGLQGQHVQIIRADKDKKVIVMHRWSEGGPKDSVVVVLNFSIETFHDYKVGFPRAGKWNLRFNSDNEQYDPEFSHLGVFDIETMDGEFDSLPIHAALEIPPYSVLVFSQED
ncbi:alpha amylase C-terminal domain-containing protein [Dyadobacter sp. LJ53]|uniref:alpha-amylase family glycosyl hydrolase n=1 Tax=Dyadobacter chenwenxiniae TaxID=2906456 RepID=UPI001F239CDB|nr:alpha-amylase family glycosyl hydrolase [Dyadobacter chenwenxiniae]MCF0048735.1 alpha amylase C-terminal domain-containing protein [Dyadobacter chenwenxiniae]